MSYHCVTGNVTDDVTTLLNVVGFEYAHMYRTNRCWLGSKKSRSQSVWKIAGLP